MAPIAPAPVATTMVQPASSDGMDYAGWVLLGGGLLLVAGGATFAMTRRPKRRVQNEVAFEPTISTSVAPAVVQPRDSRAPILATQSYVGGAGDDRHAALEAMVAEAPSEANPFHSRRNRLRRANFLLRTGQALPENIAPARQQEAAPASDRWTELSFGGNRATRVSWRPSTR